MRSVYDAIKSVVSIAPIVKTADVDGTVIDTMGYNSAKLVVAAGVIDGADGDETYKVVLKEGDAADGSDAAAVTSYELSFARDDDGKVKNLRIDGLGTSRKRYLRASLDVGGTTPSIALSAVFELGRAFNNPVQ